MSDTTRFGVQAVYGPNPTGLCGCGCGERTTIQKHDDHQYGVMAGEHRRFVAGHYHAMLRLNNPSHGRTVRLEKRRDEVRMILANEALNSDGKKSLEEIKLKYVPDFKLASCAVMLNSARVWYWHLEIPRLIVRHPRQVLPRYERPDIPYERETDLPMLVNRRNAIALDSTFSDGDAPMHECYAFGGTNPLEILMLREEMESEEYRARQARLESWNRWNEKREFFQIGKTATFRIEQKGPNP